jgi:hypothetical protein
MPPDAPVVPWRSSAFGLEVEGTFETPGLAPSAAAAGRPRTVLELVDSAGLEAAWGSPGGQRLLEEELGDRADPARSIDHKPGVGYRLHARHFGLALVDEDGARVRCAPPAGEPWSWQRFLVGRVLPWAAVLRGVEVFHASAVVRDGGALAFIGPTGAGKTSLALHLVLAGAALLTDDVLALDVDDGALRAHPGPGLLAVRRAERTRLSRERWAALGEELGDSGKAYVAVRRAEQAVPLRALYFLEPGVGGPLVRRVERPNGVQLLGSSFNQSIQTPARLRRQLDLCAELAARTPVFRLGVDPGVGAAALAEAVVRHAGGLAR